MFDQDRSTSKTLAGTGAGAGEAVKKPAVPAALEDQGRHIQQLHSALSILEKRLAPIVTAEPENVSSELMGDKEYSLSLQIASNNGHIAAAASRVNKLIRRIEI